MPVEIGWVGDGDAKGASWILFRNSSMIEPCIQKTRLALVHCHACGQANKAGGGISPVLRELLIFR